LRYVFALKCFSPGAEDEEYELNARASVALVRMSPRGIGLLQSD
jgi:hypothetical protein